MCFSYGTAFIHSILYFIKYYTIKYQENSPEATDGAIFQDPFLAKLSRGIPTLIGSKYIFSKVQNVVCVEFLNIFV